MNKPSSIAASTESSIAALVARVSRGLWFVTGGDVVQLVGGHFLTIAIAAHIYAMTGSAWAYALQQLVMFLPWMLFSSVAGPIVDRLDRRKVMIWAGLIRGLVCLGYPFCRALEQILAVSFLSSICAVFLVTARTALIPGLCDRSRLLEANGIRTAVFGVVDMSAPAIAGMLMSGIGTAAAFRFTSAAMVVGAIWFTGIPKLSGRPDPLEARTPVLAKRGFGRDLREAAAFLRGDRALLGTVVLYTVYIAGQSGTNAVFYPYVESVLHGGTAVFGMSVSCYFGANFLAGIFLTRFGRAFERMPMAMLMVPATMAWLLYPTVRQIPIVLALSFFEGMVMSVLSTLYMTDVQSKSPPAMTGRVWGLASSANGGGQVAGILLAGAIAGSRGPLTAYYALGCIGLTAVLSAELSRRRHGRRGHTGAKAAKAP